MSASTRHSWYQGTAKVQPAILLALVAGGSGLYAFRLLQPATPAEPAPDVTSRQAAIDFAPAVASIPEPRFAPKPAESGAIVHSGVAVEPPPAPIKVATGTRRAVFLARKPEERPALDLPPEPVAATVEAPVTALEPPATDIAAEVPEAAPEPVAVSPAGEAAPEVPALAASDVQAGEPVTVTEAVQSEPPAAAPEPVQLAEQAPVAEAAPVSAAPPARARTARRLIPRPAAATAAAAVPSPAEHCATAGLSSSISHSPELQVDGRALGKLELRIAPGGQVMTCLGDLVTMFRDRLGPVEYSRLHSSAAAQEFVSLQDLVLSGFSVAYDPKTDRLDLGLPAAQRGVTRQR